MTDGGICVCKPSGLLVSEKMPVRLLSVLIAKPTERAERLLP
jgi:hypothetical protein